MANRGRPGNSSFTPDQLHAFGVTNNKGKTIFCNYFEDKIIFFHFH